MTCSLFVHIPGRFSSLPQPIVDLSPIRRSASSLTQHHQDARLKDFDLERPDLTQFSMGAGQVRSQDRAHHHHHHHRCHRRRDKDKEKKQKSMERTMQPSNTVGEEDRLFMFCSHSLFVPSIVLHGLFISCRSSQIGLGLGLLRRVRHS